MIRWLPWFILFLPLAAAGGITLFKLGDRVASARMSIGAVAVSFLLSLVVFRQWAAVGTPQELRAVWLAVGALQANVVSSNTVPAMITSKRCVRGIIYSSQRC